MILSFQIEIGTRADDSGICVPSRASAVTRLCRMEGIPPHDYSRSHHARCACYRRRLRHRACDCPAAGRLRRARRDQRSRRQPKIGKRRGSDEERRLRCRCGTRQRRQSGRSQGGGRRHDPAFRSTRLLGQQCRNIADGKPDPAAGVRSPGRGLVARDSLGQSGRAVPLHPRRRAAPEGRAWRRR